MPVIEDNPEKENIHNNRVKILEIQSAQGKNTTGRTNH